MPHYKPCRLFGRAVLPNLTTLSEVLAVFLPFPFVFFLVPMVDSLAQLVRFDADRGLAVDAAHLAP